MKSCPDDQSSHDAIAIIGHPMIEVTRGCQVVNCHRAVLIDRNKTSTDILIVIIWFRGVRMKERSIPSTVIQSLPMEAQDFLRRAKPHSSSIILGGSRAVGLEQEDSDVDLCVLCLCHEDKKKVASCYRGLETEARRGRALLDAKILTQDEFGSAIQCIQNAFWHTFFKGAIALHGRMISVPLLTNQFRNTAWAAVEEVREALDFIDQEVFWDIVGYKIYSAISICYTLDCLHCSRPFTQLGRLEMADRILGEERIPIKILHDSFRLQRRVELATEAMGSSLPVSSAEHGSRAIGSLRIDMNSFMTAARQALQYAIELYRALGDSE